MSTLQERALALYTPPFRYEDGYIYDAKNEKVADDRGNPARIRGWGRLCYLPDGAELQDQVGQLMADALTNYWQAQQTTSAAPIQVATLENHLVPEPDYYVSSQHGELKISHEDLSDPAYKWYGVWTTPILYLDGQLNTKLEELDLLINLGRAQLEKLQGSAFLEPLAAQEREQAMQISLMHAELLSQAISRGYPTVSSAIAAAPEGDFGHLDLSLPPEHRLAPGRQYTPAQCSHEWHPWPVARKLHTEWCPLCDSSRNLPDT